ncbi:hypothetical protein NC652_024803 [Populus alba x Populus x berolinensis]|nr:hypothetical protein NC652_024803 [Populus alba x Populus x berolinensis]
MGEWQSWLGFWLREVYCKIMQLHFFAEEVSQQKLSTQYICRELHEADEPNLLDEEDMHVFGLMPMTDPLDLVCCNACKKPVKASQYAAHAELCRFLNSAEEMTLEPDGGTGRRKPPRKERKKLITAYSNGFVTTLPLLLIWGKCKESMASGLVLNFV